MARSGGTIKKGEIKNPKGRGLGTKDKRREFYDAMKICEEMGHNPIRYAIEMTRDDKIEATVKERANRSVMDRTTYTLKSIEYVDDRGNLEDIEKLKEQMQELTKNLKKDY